MDQLKRDLEKHLQGEVRFDEIIRKIYSIDASIYEVAPVGVVYPKTPEEVILAVKIANSYGVSVIARGAATGITGGCLGKGLIIDTSRYLDTIHKIDIHQQFAVCDPGVVQDRLNEALKPHGYRLGPDTSTGNRATLGGMLANNAAGSRSLRYGRMVDCIEEVDLVLSHGKMIHLKAIVEPSLSKNEEQNRIIQSILQIREKYRDEIASRFPHIPRRVSGYNLDELIKSGPLNPCKLVAGSEGSLGIIAKMKVAIAPCPKLTGLCLIYLDEMITGMTIVPELLAFNPLAIEMIDRHIINAGRASPSTKGTLSWLQGDPEAIFAVELEADTETDLNQKLQQLDSFIRDHFHLPTMLLQEKAFIDNFWSVRKAGLGLLLSKRSYSRAIAFIEDVSVAPTQLASFMRDFLQCLKSHGKEAGIYGHVGSGCMHIRPYIDLRIEEERQTMLAITEDVAKLLVKHGGAPSGEHGDGLVRTWLNKEIFGETLYQAFLELKQAFDPDNLMNPGKVVEGQNLLEHLHHSPKIGQATPTFQDFTSEGGFDFAVDMCNGNGQCRKKEGTMCPSFQVTNNEYDTTRARAQALRGISMGTNSIDSFDSDAIYDVLDLCLECKGCKSECPSQVDMAKLKAEFLYQYQEKKGYFFRNRLFAGIDKSTYLGSFFPNVYNAITQMTLSKKLFDLLGITNKRAFPQLAPKQFSTFYAKTEQPASDKFVVLFNDTYSEYYDPEIGQAALFLLNQLGYQVIVPPWECCGRPAISKGLLHDAKRKAERIVSSLYPHVAKGIPILGLEPSCILTLKDDYRGLLGYSHEKAKTVALASFTIDEFLYLHLDELIKLLPENGKSSQPVHIHGHCHQKALIGMQPSLECLKAFFEHVTLIDDGCCGVAGSFGYEKEHYDLSIEIANLKLLPALKIAHKDSLIIANGTSCRSQITHNTDFKPQHLVQSLSAVIQSTTNKYY